MKFLRNLRDTFETCVHLVGQIGADIYDGGVHISIFREQFRRSLVKGRKLTLLENMWNEIGIKKKFRMKLKLESNFKGQRDTFAILNCC